MYCRAHKTATLTPIQHTVQGGVLGATLDGLVQVVQVYSWSQCHPSLVSSTSSNIVLWWGWKFNKVQNSSFFNAFYFSKITYLRLI